MPTAEFTVTTDARGKLVVCTYDGETGAARVFASRGENEARQRAEAQARKKAAERDAAA